MNRTIHVTGHTHPDSDSICSAMAYTELLKAMGQDAVACRQGPLNEETKFILKRFNQENPLLMTDARAMIKDIEYDEPTCISKHATVHDAWHVMLRTQDRTLIVVDDDDRLCGVCSTSDLSSFRLKQVEEVNELMSTATLDDIADTIGGTVIHRPENFKTNGAVHIMTLEGSEIDKFNMNGGINILSSNREKQIDLIEAGTRCLIITCGIHIDPEALKIAEEKGCAVVETPRDTMHTATVILESHSIEHVMTKDVISFKDTEFVKDVAAKIIKSRVRAYPVLNEDGDVVGSISRYHTQNYNRLRFALVDHSAKNQSAAHIEDAELVSVVDHHHIGDIQTDYPVNWRTVKCGCTSTIICTMYRELGIVPEKEICGLMLSAILSDTLNFKATTATELDREAADWLAERAGIEDIDDYAREMLGASVALIDSTPHEILTRDLKSYEIGNYRFAIGQTNFSRAEEVQRILPAFRENMEKEAEEMNLDLLVMLFTDVMGEGSYFLFYGPLSNVVKDTVETVFDDHFGFDPDIISRKQQLMPKISSFIKAM